MIIAIFEMQVMDVLNQYWDDVVMTLWTTYWKSPRSEPEALRTALRLCIDVCISLNQLSVFSCL